jgi:hypothetical protein
LTYPDRTTVLYKLRERPNHSSSSLELEAAIYSETHQRLAARCVETNAIYDYRVAKRTTLPSFMVGKLQEIYDMQAEAAENSLAEVYGLLDAVQELETKTA